ncbi:uncharacterized protein B0H18DRAFT_77824 [Fomitopsis serialis]|uniref:uncharacterized protein n=1 Tax=Fomitopsis serialis TaxID=139415 RepID=UPI002008C7EA|nr:uncharacterized protein B0H18DRAFT_77824 [Neoantrodia serialis]KAH9916031.1 hypothetical protein B0H18DRAFT_77824 [Neoantrodia serialis]
MILPFAFLGRLYYTSIAHLCCVYSAVPLTTDLVASPAQAMHHHMPMQYCLLCTLSATMTILHPLDAWKAGDLSLRYVKARTSGFDDRTGHMLVHNSTVHTGLRRVNALEERRCLASAKQARPVTTVRNTTLVAAHFRADARMHIGGYIHTCASSSMHSGTADPSLGVLAARS